MVETRTSGGDKILWWRQGPVGRQGLVMERRTNGETRSCGGDNDQWGDKVLW